MNPDFLCFTSFHRRNAPPPAFLWAIWDTPPSLRFECGLAPHPPLLSGGGATAREIIGIAAQYGFPEPKVSPDSRMFEAFAMRSVPLVSHQKRPNGTYALAAWPSPLSFLLGEAPACFADHLSAQDLPALIRQHGNDNALAAEGAGGFIRSYLRQCEARRKFAAPPLPHGPACAIRFVYADHNEKFYGRKKRDWHRHRIVKTTARHIFIDEYPFFERSYLRHGWQAHVIFTLMLDRAAFEQAGEFFHYGQRTTFYSSQTAKRRRWTCYVGEESAQSVIELPPNEIEWATRLLELPGWPADVTAIKKAFARKALDSHPDRGGNAPLFIRCKAARDFLIDQLPG